MFFFIREENPDPNKYAVIKNTRVDVTFILNFW